MASVFVQADDFSGAAEVGYCFVQHGLSTQLTLGTHDSDASFRGLVTDVVVADTHSRGLAESAAEALVKKAFSGGVASAAQVAFKKIDSLWRGNVRAEVAALTTLGFHAVVAGALPQLQRSVQNGQPLVAGTPLVETDLWQAELFAPPTDIPSLLRPEDPSSVESLDLDEVRSGSLTAKLSALLESGEPGLVVADGETVQDIEHVVDALLELNFQAGNRPIVLVGTGGTADVLAQRLAAQLARNAQVRAQADAPPAQPQGTAKPVLAVVGSASATAQAQLGQLETQGFEVIRLHPQYAGATGAYGPQLQEARVALAAGINVAVTLAAGKVDPARAASIVQALSTFAAEAAQGLEADLILTGGETAREVLDAVGLHSLVPLAAVQHGAVLSRADDGTLVGTKPGSFGDDLALLQLYDELRERRGQSAPAPANTLPRKTSERSGAEK